MTPIALAKFYRKFLYANIITVLNSIKNLEKV